jgi:Secretion system C-terminal sorting domain
MGTFFGIGPAFSPFLIRTLSKQTASGYTGFLPKRLPKVPFITSSIKVDSLSFLITGTDSSGNAIAVYYRYMNSDSLLWATQLGLGVMFNADTSASSVYTLSQKNNLALSVGRLNKNTGAIQWQKDITAPAGSVYFPVNIQYNSYKNRVMVAGFIKDTTKALPDNRYFYITFDTSGNTIRSLEKSGDMQGDTRINDIDVLQNGLTVIGGSIMTELYGKAGFYNSTDTAASIITGIRFVNGLDDFSAIVYPNPSKTEVLVQFIVRSFCKKLNFTLLNTEGKIVSIYSLKNVYAGTHTQRVLLNFQPGVYYLKLDDNESKVSVRPILILR